MPTLTAGAWLAPQLCRRPHDPICSPLFHQHANTRFDKSGAGQATSVQVPPGSVRRQIPIVVRGTAGCPTPAISCLGAFRTPAAVPCGELILAGVRKPAQERTLTPRD